MKNQFFYTRKELVSGTPENPVFKEFRDSFNVRKVIRTLGMDDGRLLVLLDDIHQRAQEVPVHNKQGKITSYKRETNVFQSEIYLEVEDVERFYETVLT
jgi:hypothetical protein